jgi:hypothetical protein
MVTFGLEPVYPVMVIVPLLVVKVNWALAAKIPISKTPIIDASFMLIFPSPACWGFNLTSNPFVNPLLSLQT